MPAYTGNRRIPGTSIAVLQISRTTISSESFESCRNQFVVMRVDKGRAGVALASGLALLYLSWTPQQIRSRYPETGEPADAGRSGFLAVTDMPFDTVTLVVLGLFILILGVLLVPVSFGLLPFSGSAQLGLMMVIFAVQMVAIGSTPVGPFRRTRLMVLLGLTFAVLGTASCIIPGLLVKPLTVLIGLMNLVGGIAALVKFVGPALRGHRQAAPVPRIQRQIAATTLVMNVLAVIFGTSMLIPGIIPGLILGGVLAANGCVMLVLVFLLMRVQRMLAAATR